MQPLLTRAAAGGPGAAGCPPRLTRAPHSARTNSWQGPPAPPELWVGSTLGTVLCADGGPCTRCRAGVRLIISCISTELQTLVLHFG